MNKHHKLVIAWFIISGLIVFTAVRQIQVLAQEKQRSHQPLPPPLKTRHAIRPPVRPWSGDPVADYVARCKKGLTDREIGWLLEDFRNAGLDLDYRNPKTTFGQLTALRAAQHRWYADALADVFHLNAEQSALVKSDLTNILNKDRDNFIQLRETLLPNDASVGTSPFVEAEKWLLTHGDPFDENLKPSLQPWNLCQLTSAQEKLTWKFSMNPGLAPILSPAEDRPNESQSPIPEFLTSPPSELTSDVLAVPQMFRSSNVVLPYLKSQTFIIEWSENDDSEENLLSNLRKLHPAQFKLVLLFHPEIVGKVQNLLESGVR